MKTSLTLVGKSRAASGQCVICASPRGEDGTTRWCRLCADKHSQRITARRQARWAARNAEGMCVTCDQPPLAGKRRCEGCCAKSSARGVALVEKRGARGHCRQCSAPRIPDSAMCLKHWLQAKSKEHWGHVRNWETLLALAERQRWRCHYTGEVLTPGANMSLDHRIAKAHPAFPGHDDMTNLAWTTKALNLAKNRHSEDEFIALCERVLAHRALLLVEGSHLGRPAESRTLAA